MGVSGMAEPSDDVPDGELLDIDDSVSSLQAFGSALLSGVAGFFVVTAIVTEVAIAWIEFSVLVGLPAGLLAGVLIAGAVYRAGSRGRPGRSQQLAAATVAFAAGFLLVWFGLGTVLERPTSQSILAASIVGFILAALAVHRGR